MLNSTEQAIVDRLLYQMGPMGITQIRYAPRGSLENQNRPDGEHNAAAETIVEGPYAGTITFGTVDGHMDYPAPTITPYAQWVRPAIAHLLPEYCDDACVEEEAAKHPDLLTPADYYARMNEWTAAVIEYYITGIVTHEATHAQQRRYGHDAEFLEMERQVRNRVGYYDLAMRVTRGIV